MKPLTTVLKKEAQEKFQWTTEAEQFFEVLKLAIVSSTILIMPDFNLPFVVECNASTSGVGAVLIQQNRPMVDFQIESNCTVQFNSVFSLVLFNFLN